MDFERVFSAQEEVLEFLTTQPSPEQIIAFTPSAAAQERLHILLEKNKSSALTADEELEVDEHLRLGRFMNMLRIKARQKLA